MKKNFLTGLAILLPLAVTLAILKFLVGFLTDPFIGIVSGILEGLGLAKQGFLLLSPEQTLLFISQIFILIFLFLFTVLLGVLTSWFIGKSLLRLADKIMRRIPLVKVIYRTVQDIIQTLFQPDKDVFKKVVLVPFPKPGIYVMGFVSREAPSILSEKVGEELISVLIPNTPNPTTAFLVLFKREDLIYVDMKPEEAFKYIISCGVIVPEASEKL